jgi:hypothetical protein
MKSQLRLLVKTWKHAILCLHDAGQLQRIHETHRSYDALQYPLMFWKGDDGYHFNIKMINSLSGEETTKQVSSMNYYAYRLMIRQNAENYLLRFRRLLQQYCVDMYVKIESSATMLSESFRFALLPPALCSCRVHLRGWCRDLLTNAVLTPG